MTELGDHCHGIGKYGGATHSIHKLKYSIPKKSLCFSTMDQTLIIILSF